MKVKKTKSNPRSRAKRNGKRGRSTPLLAASTLVRRGKLRPGERKGSNRTSPTHPLLTGIALMGPVITAYGEFFARIAQCRSPIEIWLGQMGFIQLLSSYCYFPAFRG